PPRSERPHDAGAGAEAAQGPSHDPSCPFCPGNEDQLAAILSETPGDDGGWATRVVPNRYPAFTNDPTRGEWVDAYMAAAGSGVGKCLRLGSDVPVVLADPLPAVGYQEVIIDTPRHDRDLTDMEPDELGRVLSTYHARYVSVSESAPACRVFLFRNRGREAGTSLVHPHAQLIATAVVPPEIRVREIRALGYYGDHGRCLVCALPDIEPAWSERTVARSVRFTAFVPWAAETPFEVWIVPRKHQAEFGQATREDLHDLAGILSEVLGKLRDRAGDPPLNLIVHSPRRSRSGSKAFHWTIQLRPRASQLAGFELASGILINASSPVQDARTLRGEG
ncbi:MAG: galactose-1-phosphate uridylyltransferase, partial [Gemmatimonadota bacterium]